MSAHRPQWNPTQGRESKAGSQQISKHQLASYTKLKFRQPGQTSTSDVARRDLRAELAAAERAAADKKRREQGLAPLPVSGALAIEAGEGEGEGEEDEERRKRRRILEEAAELDRDDDDDEEEEEEGEGEQDKGKGKVQADDEAEDDDDDDDDDDSDDEDDAAALMAELAKIKSERAEEKARQDAESAAASAVDRDAEIATGNPLLNLQAALGQSPSSAASAGGATPRSSAASSTFAVKRRWDDDLIFKNQAAGIDDRPKKGEFVNDLLRSEFHKKFMLKFIK